MQADILTLDNILQNFSTDEKSRLFLETWLWPDGPTCPRCKSTDKTLIHKMNGKSHRAGLYHCRACRRAFTVTVGTIFEDSHIPLRKWIIAWFLICSSKKGMSSLQLKRMLDLGSYRTALFMTHRIRHALKDMSFEKQLTGHVEVDETYVGGKNTGRGHKAKLDNKTCVVSLVQRNGDKRSIVMDKVTGDNLLGAVREHVEVGSTVLTDDFFGYRRMPKIYTHSAVKHSAKEYARREKDFVAHTNTAESAFSLLKRGVIGTFHSVSKHHLHFYLSEFDYRWNTRKATDGERTISGLQKSRGKRLTYKAIRGTKGSTCPSASPIVD